MIIIHQNELLSCQGATTTNCSILPVRKVSELERKLSERDGDPATTVVPEPFLNPAPATLQTVLSERDGDPARSVHVRSEYPHSVLTPGILNARWVQFSNGGHDSLLSDPEIEIQPRQFSLPAPTCARTSRPIPVAFP